MARKKTPYPELRTQTVNKANVIIQRARYSMPLSQQKIILYLISTIRPTDDDFRVYDLKIQEFCQFCGIYDSGKNYADLKAALQKVANQSFWVEDEDGTQKLVRWLDMVHIRPRDGTMRLRIHSEMRPYLLHLQQHFTSYQLLWVSRFKSKFSIRLYELLRSYHYDKRRPYTRQFDLEELKQQMGAEGYTRWINFRQKCLEPSLSDIEAYSDMTVKWEPVKEGKRIVGITFTMATKPKDARQRLERDTNKALGIDPDQLTFWNILYPADDQPAGDLQT